MIFTRRKGKRKEVVADVRKTYPLRENYNGAFKILGQDIFMPIDSQRNNNVLVLGHAGSGKRYNYVRPNLKDANKDSNFILHTIRTKAEDIKELLPDYNVIVLNLEERPVDYFSLITNEMEAIRFVDRVMEAEQVNKEEKSSDAFFDTAQKKMLLEAIAAVLNNGSCTCAAVQRRLADEDIMWSEELTRLSTNTRRFIVANCLTLIDRLQAEGTVNLAEIIDKVRDEENTILLVNRSLSPSLYESIFMDMLIYQYEKQYFAAELKSSRHVRVILDEAQACSFDAGMFAKLTRRVNMSVDFLYQDINQAYAMNPDAPELIVTNVTAIVCLGTRSEDTSYFLNRCWEMPSGMNPITLPAEQELILCSQLDENWIMADKISIA